MNIIEKTDDEILAVAHPMWDDLIRYSNEGEYGKFIRKFSYELLFGLNEVEVGKQFAKSELTRSLDTSCLLYTSPSPRDRQKSRMPSSA